MPCLSFKEVPGSLAEQIEFGLRSGTMRFNCSFAMADMSIGFFGEMERNRLGREPAFYGPLKMFRRSKRHIRN
jgi:hypothetical protein